jgi:hypothetical protein
MISILKGSPPAAAAAEGEPGWPTPDRRAPATPQDAAGNEKTRRQLKISQLQPVTIPRNGAAATSTVGGSRLANGRKTGGRVAGTPNKFSADLRAMILGALDAAGGQEFLTRQANQNPNAFMALLGRILPLQMAGDGGGAVIIRVVTGVPGRDDPEEEERCVGASDAGSAEARA